jgi:TetR/AcrR family transcriptional regulator, transcriptional repressor of bet genes
VPYYKLGDDEEEPLLLELQKILEGGQKAGEFRAFNVVVMAKAIQGAIGEYMGNPNTPNQIDVAVYGKELVRIFERAILADLR